MERKQTDENPEQTAEAVLANRQKIYGDPVDTMTVMAAMSLPYFHERRCTVERLKGDPLGEAHDQAISMMMSKLARIASGDFHEDNYVDLINYARIAFNCAKYHRS